MPRGKRDRRFISQAVRNNQTYLHYYDRLAELSMSMFEWKDVPDSIDVRFLELTLFERGSAVYFNDEVLGNLALPCATMGMFNVYHIPMKRKAFASNGYYRELDDKDSVIIYNNYLHKNSIQAVEYFAWRLYRIQSIIDVNVNAQKTPVLVRASEQQKLTMENLYMKYDGNEPFIFGDKNLDLNNLSVLKTDAPYISDKLYTLKTQTWNEALTYLGISNTNTQKKERMVSEEVTRNLGGVIASRYSRLESRREAVDKINKMFDTNISVDYRIDFREADDEIMFEGDTGSHHVMSMANDIRTQ